MDAGTQPKSIFSVYEYLKQRPLVSGSFAAKGTELSFNSVSKPCIYCKNMVLLSRWMMVNEIAYGYIGL